MGCDLNWLRRLRRREQPAYTHGLTFYGVALAKPQAAGGAASAKSGDRDEAPCYSRSHVSFFNSVTLSPSLLIRPMRQKRTIPFPLPSGPTAPGSDPRKDQKESGDNAEGAGYDVCRHFKHS